MVRQPCWLRPLRRDAKVRVRHGVTCLEVLGQGECHLIPESRKSRARDFILGGLDRLVLKKTWLFIRQAHLDMGLR